MSAWLFVLHRQVVVAMYHGPADTDSEGSSLRSHLHTYILMYVSWARNRHPLFLHVLALLQAILLLQMVWLASERTSHENVSGLGMGQKLQYHTGQQNLETRSGGADGTVHRQNLITRIC